MTFFFFAFPEISAVESELIPPAAVDFRFWLDTVDVLDGPEFAGVSGKLFAPAPLRCFVRSSKSHISLSIKVIRVLQRLCSS